jgi:hypothetical protein
MELWVGWGSNPQPTPNAFGAALPVELTQEEDRYSWVLLGFELLFEFPSCLNGRHFFRGHELQWSAKATGRMYLASAMLSEALVEMLC